MAHPSAPSKTLPADGMSRWNQIKPFSPISREKFRQLVKAGKAPQPVKFSKRCTAYQNRELHRFFADPLNYRAEVKQGENMRAINSTQKSIVRSSKGFHQFKQVIEADDLNPAAEIHDDGKPQLFSTNPKE